jgi:hypothetical protein
MKTEHLYNKINELETLRSRGELTYMGGEMLSEFNEIKQALLINDVSNRRELLIALAKDFKEGFISCDRINPEKYVDDYLSNL